MRNLNKYNLKINVDKFEKSVQEKLEYKLLIKVEKILRILEKEEVKNSILTNKIEKDSKNHSSTKNKLKESKKDLKQFREEVKKLKSLNEDLNSSVEILNELHAESVVVSVDLLSDLDYNQYKASFIDIDISTSHDSTRLKKYLKNIKRFFLEELKSSYLYISYSGINENIRSAMKIKANKQYANAPDLLGDVHKVYYIELTDNDLPERRIGRIILGRYPYKDEKKEKNFSNKIDKELILTRSLLQNVIAVIHNKDYAVKDALTGLNNRKMLEEKLSDEFNLIDMVSNLEEDDRNVFKTIKKADSQPLHIVRNQFFQDFNNSDEKLFQTSLKSLTEKGIISISKHKYLGELKEFCFFEKSKTHHNLFVAMFDLDHFKDVNDNWGGHDAGDIVLKNFSKILKQNIRTTDIPIRYGGEEFLIIFTRAASLEKIVEILEKIRVTCERELIVNYKKKVRNVTVSVGLTRVNKFDLKVNQIISRADAALYRAKNVRNRLIFYDQDQNGYKKVDL